MFLSIPSTFVEGRWICVLDLQEYEKGDYVGKWVCVDGKTEDEIKKEIPYKEFGVYNTHGFEVENLTEKTTLREVLEQVQD